MTDDEIFTSAGAPRRSGAPGSRMPLSPSETRGLLERLGHFPRRALGQNFLVDGNIVRKSVGLAEIAPGAPVVEVGPGLGTLTRALLDAGAEVWAIEKDERLHAHLQAEIPPDRAGRLHLMLGDAVEAPLAGYPAQDHVPFKVVANLPYAISTPWLDAVLSGVLPERMVLMLQKEAAQRYGAEPGTKSFGAISIFLQAAYQVERGHAVAPACFHPRPDVESHLLALRRKASPYRFSSPAKALIRACFQQRRKQIGALLRGHASEGADRWLEQLAAAGLSPQTRPEAIPVPLWMALGGSSSAA